MQTLFSCSSLARSNVHPWTSAAATQLQFGVDSMVKAQSANRSFDPLILLLVCVRAKTIRSFLRIVWRNLPELFDVGSMLTVDSITIRL